MLSTCGGMWGIFSSQNACLHTNQDGICEGGKNTIFHLLWSQCSRSVLNHIISLLGWIFDRANRLGLCECVSVCACVYVCMCVCVCVCVCVLGVWVVISELGFWVLLLFFLPPTHLLPTQTNTAAVASQSPPLSLSIASTCVTLHVLPWRSLMLPPHFVSLPLPVWGRSRLVADDAGRLQTSSLPSGRRPIFTTGHKVYQAAQHIYGTASNPSLPGKHLPPRSASLSPFIAKKHCSTPSNAYFYPLNWDDSSCEGFFKILFCFCAVFYLWCCIHHQKETPHSYSRSPVRSDVSGHPRSSSFRACREGNKQHFWTLILKPWNSVTVKGQKKTVEQ